MRNKIAQLDTAFKNRDFALCPLRIFLNVKCLLLQNKFSSGAPGSRDRPAALESQKAATVSLGLPCGIDTREPHREQCAKFSCAAGSPQINAR
jgi:hypothetical protein